MVRSVSAPERAAHLLHVVDDCRQVDVYGLTATAVVLFHEDFLLRALRSTRDAADFTDELPPVSLVAPLLLPPFLFSKIFTCAFELLFLESAGDGKIWILKASRCCGGCLGNGLGGAGLDIFEGLGEWAGCLEPESTQPDTTTANFCEAVIRFFASTRTVPC